MKIQKSYFLFVFILFLQLCSISENLQVIFGGSIFFQMVFCATFMAVILLSLDYNLTSITFDVVINLFSLLLELLLNYTSSNHAQSLTDRSLQVGENFYNIFWYVLPCNQQKVVQFTIHRAQIPFYIHGYKMFTCSMETFLTVGMIKIYF